MLPVAGAFWTLGLPLNNPDTGPSIKYMLSIKFQVTVPSGAQEEDFDYFAMYF